LLKLCQEFDPTRLASVSCFEGDEEQVHEFADIEEAFNAAMPRIMEGYVARITDKHGVARLKGYLEYLATAARQR